MHMPIAVLQGKGALSGLSHPEFAGSGQGIQAGMLMLGDRLNPRRASLQRAGIVKYP